MAKQKAATSLPEHRKNFVDLIRKFSDAGYSSWSVFEDFLTVSAIAIANNSDTYYLANSKATVDEREARYKRIITKYKKDLQPLFADMLSEIVSEMESYCPNDLTDVLGEIFHELEFHNSWKGQFFSPKCICDCIGRMNFAGVDFTDKLTAKGFVTLNEPACGGGAMILGAANGMRVAGLNPQKELLIVANDIDERCVHMCYIQLSLYGLPAIVLQQNALTQETFGEPWYTPMFVADGWTWRARRAFDAQQDEPQEIPTTKEIPCEEVYREDIPCGQLSLF